MNAQHLDLKKEKKNDPMGQTLTMSAHKRSLKDERDLLASYRRGPVDTCDLTGRLLLPDPLAVHKSVKRVLTPSHSLQEMERLAILEQAFKAALETGDLILAKSRLDSLTERFPVAQSGRLQILYGLYHQHLKEFDVADAYFDMAVDLEEANGQARKMKITSLLAQGKRRDAIESLVLYLDIFMQDQEAWSQLSDLYLQENMFQQSAFCIEELLIQRPHHPFYQMRYADLQVMMEDYPLAIKYYSLTLTNCEDHLRALYGLWNATTCLIKALKSDTVVKSRIQLLSLDIAQELQELATERISSVYQGSSEFRDRGLENIVKEWLGSKEKL